MLLLTFLSGSALAQTKIATVDMNRLFENYWKTKQAQAALEDNTAQLTKDENGWKDELKKGTDEYQRLLAQANDQAVSADERDRRKQAADDKLKQLEARRAVIQQTDQTTRARLSDQIQRMTEKIVAEITSHVTDAAKAGGYTVVLNSAGKASMPSPVVYSANSVDLTADVLKQLNDGAPIDLTTPSNAAPARLTAPSLLNTNSP